MSSFPSYINSDTPNPNPNTYLFEIGWEICRRIGGIYTVLQTKAPFSSEQFPEHYCCIGPLIGDLGLLIEFELLQPQTPLFQQVLKNCSEKYNLKLYFGRWLIKGYPKVILIDLNFSGSRIGEWRNNVGIPSYRNDPETDESIIFGYQCALIMQEFVNCSPSEKFICHFHEWLVGVGLILLKKWKVKIATIFTTHATLLGRYLSAGKVNFYHYIDKIDSEKEAFDRGIYQRVWIERGAALGADVFTTISDITNLEAKNFLGRSADILLPNGLQVEKFEALHEFQNLHLQFKKVIHEFVRGHFCGHYTFDLDNTLYFFTAGRYETFNKGFDLFLKALQKLNQLLVETNTNIHVVGFVITNARTSNCNVESLNAQTINRQLHQVCDTITEKLREKLYEVTAKGNLISPADLLSEEDVILLKRRIVALKQRKDLPPVVTHNMVDQNDEILNIIRETGLFNNRNDKVKIIYHPEFINPVSPLIPLEYVQFVRGCHLGVFPSAYEPWGYTISECVVLGVSNVSSNLTGFANYMQNCVEDCSASGVYVIDRLNQGFNNSVSQLADIMFKFCQFNRRERIELRNRTQRLSDLLSWNSLHSHYNTARKLALERVYSS